MNTYNEDQVYQLIDTDPNDLNIMGQGKKKLLILALMENSHESDLATIKKLVAAIKHDFESDLYFTWLQPKDKLSLSGLKLNYNRLLLFGVKPEDIGLNINYQTNTIIKMEDLSLIATDSIIQLNANPKVKTALWEKLQVLFL